MMNNSQDLENEQIFNIIRDKCNNYNNINLCLNLINKIKVHNLSNEDIKKFKDFKIYEKLKNYRDAKKKIINTLFDKIIYLNDLYNVFQLFINNDNHVSSDVNTKSLETFKKLIQQINTSDNLENIINFIINLIHFNQNNEKLISDLFKELETKCEKSKIIKIYSEILNNLSNSIETVYNKIIRYFTNSKDLNLDSNSVINIITNLQPQTINLFLSELKSKKIIKKEDFFELNRSDNLNLLIKIFEDNIINKIQNQNKYIHYSSMIVNEIMNDIKDLNFSFEKLSILNELLKNEREIYERSIIFSLFQIDRMEIIYHFRQSLEECVNFINKIKLILRIYI